MSNNLLYLLLLLAFARVNGQNMESISSQSVVKPGETLSLSCRGSGFTFGSYDMHWVRQQPGKALVWMGRVWAAGNGHDYAKSFEGRIEITRDNSKSMVYLKLSRLTEEDSAVYFCARQAQ
ncbi:immunoglobulin heavy variable 3-33 [Megalobrama amblycephala]|uniref:immunoglobulin heavy variable 3-33 n=1 Tax=Megalobrama amblycephala TaxID=75352 RepID=UPI002013DA98|nr:immunoglobulin heavy variable 3-33 [Megalobrama amblycephala]